MSTPQAAFHLLRNYANDGPLLIKSRLQAAPVFRPRNLYCRELIITVLIPRPDGNGERVAALGFACRDLAPLCNRQRSLNLASNIDQNGFRANRHHRSGNSFIAVFVSMLLLEARKQLAKARLFLQRGGRKGIKVHVTHDC